MRHHCRAPDRPGACAPTTCPRSERPQLIAFVLGQIDTIAYIHLRLRVGGERYLAGRSLMTWSADFPADDWKHISDSEIAARALQRIEVRGRGMLLLHDIKPATVLALPIILRELKSRGYRIVHVEPATPERTKTATLPAQWLVRGNGRWPSPELSIEVLLAESVLPAPAPASFGLADSFLPGDAVALPRMRTYAAARGQVPLPPCRLPSLMRTARSGAGTSQPCS